MATNTCELPTTAQLYNPMKSNPKGPDKGAVRRMFDKIAPSYDPINSLLSFGTDHRWRRLLVARVAQDHPDKVLDLAAGTGEVTIRLAEALEGAHIVAADLSEGMLTIARGKVERKGLQSRVSLVVADAEALPFADGEFDTVTLSFGIRNFSAPATAVAELYRTTRAGATVRIMEFGMPKGRVFGCLYRFYQRWVMPFVGGLLSGKWSAYRYLPASIEAFDRRVDVAALLAEAGFVEVTSEPLTRGIARLYSAKKMG